GVVTEGDPVGRLAGAPVTRDGDPDLRAAGAHQVGTVESELGQRTGTAGLDHDVGASEHGAQDPDVIVVPKVQSDGSLASVQQVEELRWAPACAVRSLRRFDLDDRRAGASEEVSAQRARPER